MMSATFSYTLLPLPPTHPRTTGGKHAPSAPLQSKTLDNENAASVSDHNPQIRLTTFDISSNRPKTKSSIVYLSSYSNARSHFTAIKSGLSSVHSSPTLSTTNNNNPVILNLNHVTSSASTNHSIVTTNLLVPSYNVGSACNPNSINENNVILPTTINTDTASSLTDNNHLNSITSTLSPVPSSTSQSTNAQLLSSTSWQPSQSVNGHTPQFTNGQLSPSTNGQPSEIINLQLNTSGITNLDSQSTTTTLSDNNSDNDSGVSTTTTAHSHMTKDSVSPTSPIDHLFGSSSSFAYEHDHDYESVGSPCSSTASGPTYVRPVGFTHHAQEIEVPPVKSKLKKKKYLTSLVTVREGYKKRESTPPKIKPKREPLPMKLRALPQSFWQQPNVAHQVSPATLFLPPLLNKDSEEVMMDVRPVTPPEERDIIKKSQAPERKVIVTNTDLLFKLFDGIGEGKKLNNSFKSRAVKVRKLIPKSSTKGLLLGNDPYMVDAVTEKIFPQLTLEGSRYCSGGGNTSLQLITLKEGDRTVTLPSLTLEQNYPQMLSELVSHI